MPRRRRAAMTASLVHRTPRSARRARPRNAGCSPIVMLPAALAAAMAPTVIPLRVFALAEPIPPLRLAVVAPSPAPTLPSEKSRAGVFCSFVAELAIGGIASPIFVAARQQIKQDCPWHDRNTGVANLKTATLFAKPCLYARCGVEPESRSAGLARWRRCLPPFAPGRGGPFHGYLARRHERPHSRSRRFRIRLP